VHKKHIIDEIIRTAKANNGIPLGKKGFERETGIKYSDWYGIDWTKRGDAVREAGYEPNKMQTAYDQNVLIEQVISLIREKRKFPTSGEIRLKAHNTGGFAFHSAFTRRLGKKSATAQKILNYCKERSGYEDVIEICKNISHFSEKEREAEPEKELRPTCIRDLKKEEKVGNGLNCQVAM